MYSLEHLIICCVIMILCGIAVGWYFGFNAGSNSISKMHQDFMNKFNLEYTEKEKSDGIKN